MNTLQRFARNPTWEQIKEFIQDSVTVAKTGCWEWKRGITQSGYGRCWGTSAHRMSYQAYIGPIGKGLDIDHLCRNRICCNPAHLEPVTRRENLERGLGIVLQKKRAAEKVVCSAGHSLSGDNVYIRPSDGVRVCRSCRLKKESVRYASTKDAINARKREWRRKWKEKGIRK